MNIGLNSVVSFHYHLTNDAGEVIDSSRGQEPLTYLHGTGGIIPGLERALEGKKVGDKMQVTVQPEDGYGPVHNELIQEVPRNAFEDMDVRPGMHFQASGPNGQTLRVTVDSVTGDKVIVNGNHPLAGKVLHFDVSIEAVRAATAEEISHGHVHDGHSHH